MAACLFFNVKNIVCHILKESGGLRQNILYSIIGYFNAYVYFAFMKQVQMTALIAVNVIFEK